MDARDLKPGALFTTDGQDAWKLESYFTVPSCSIVNMETGAKETFGMGGLTADTFVPLIPDPTRTLRAKP